MFIETIKQIVKNTIESEKLVAVVFGTVTSESPLLIKLSDKIELEYEDFISTDDLTGLKQGARLVLLRVQGGQKFLVLKHIKD